MRLSLIMKVPFYDLYIITLPLSIFNEKRTTSKDRVLINIHPEATQRCNSCLSISGRYYVRTWRVGRPQTSSSPPVIFIAGRPKAALLFWFFGDFRCGALLSMVIHVTYKYKNR